ncbi:MAG: phosphoglucomutase (alpha-D-glucose-1,6-bisphosphate-dependent) [Calditerrivibrio sp.]|nr:phosphoglucomutase (alpha-D-glucose-1,6-bisphosphate-dependent) [Calditerrivibrio sp.]
MKLHPLAGKPVSKRDLPNIPKIVSEYYVVEPDINSPRNRVSFGTSGHRGTSSNGSFNEHHIAAITQAICNYRKIKGINGPLFLGKDTHALSEPAFITALEVLVGNGVTVMISEGTEWTPTPAVSYAILKFNRNNKVLADGIVITPSHNPPDDGGFKYNPPSGGPADTEITSWLEKEANRLIENDLEGVKGYHFLDPSLSSYVKRYNYMKEYVDDLNQVLNMTAISNSKIKIAADVLGGSGLDYYGYIAEKYKIDIKVFNDYFDPTFSFMTYDKDGKIRMDCSSPYAMASLIDLKDRFDIAFGNDPDFDRHGVVTRKGGLMNSNHFLAVAVWYLFTTRDKWKKDAAVGKTAVSSFMIDKVTDMVGRNVYEVPVGFKWFVDGLLDGNLGFGGEESAGGSFLRFDGSVWSTDKDGIIMCLLAAEILACTGKDPFDHYSGFEERFGKAYYTRLDIASSFEEKEKIKKISKDVLKTDTVAGEKIINISNRASGNNASLGGVKVITENGWFAVRPSGTEDIYKIYAESFKSESHLSMIVEEAQNIIKKL